MNKRHMFPQVRVEFESLSQKLQEKLNKFTDQGVWPSPIASSTTTTTSPALYEHHPQLTKLHEGLLLGWFKSVSQCLLLSVWGLPEQLLDHKPAENREDDCVVQYNNDKEFMFFFLNKSRDIPGILFIGIFVMEMWLLMLTHSWRKSYYTILLRDKTMSFTSCSSRRTGRSNQVHLVGCCCISESLSSSGE